MPFLDYLELAAVSGMAESTARHVLGRLQRKGLANYLRHASPLTATTRRWFATADGLRSLASENGTGIERLLRTHPVSAHWRRILLARLDAVAVVYRLASAVADAVGPPRFRWYRAAPLDAAMTLPDDRTAGVIRQGPTADRTSISDRIRRLMDPQQYRPRALLALMPDEAKLRQARRLLARYPGPVYLTLEKDVSGMLADDRGWRGTSAPNLLSLREIFAHLRPSGTLPWEAPASRLALPDDTDLCRVGDGVPDHLLPVVLKPAEKRMLDCLADWPLITAVDLGGILGLSPSGVSKLARPLGELGLALRRAYPTAVAGWRSATGGWLSLPAGTGSSLGLPIGAGASSPSTASLPRPGGTSQAGAAVPLPGPSTTPRRCTVSWRRWRGRRGGRRASLSCKLSPQHHASRYFRHGGSLRSIHPDAFGVVRANGHSKPVFLEWERRALHPSTMAARLALYLRYYSSNRPLDDHGERPLVLIAFEDSLAEANFLGVARTEMERLKVGLPLLGFP